jgi:hypothetical protein
MNNNPITPGHAAYLEDCVRKPTYHTGEPRPTWQSLDEWARWSWEREPTPRQWSTCSAEDKGVLEQAAWYDTSAELS